MEADEVWSASTGRWQSSAVLCRLPVGPQLGCSKDVGPQCVLQSLLPLAPRQDLPWTQSLFLL